MRKIAVVIMAFALVSALAGTADAAPKVRWHGAVYQLKEGGVGRLVQSSSAWVASDEAKVAFKLATRGLERRHAYTNWLFVYNFPQACIDPDAARGFRCGHGDFGNAAAGFSLMYGTGAVSTEAGKAVFAGERHALDMDRVLLGPGLLEPKGAEVHIMVRDHGPASKDPKMLEQQTGTVDGNCNNPAMPPTGLWGEAGDYACQDVQTTGAI
jgi:hypothetical protein